MGIADLRLVCAQHFIYSTAHPAMGWAGSATAGARCSQPSEWAVSTVPSFTA